MILALVQTAKNGVWHNVDVISAWDHGYNTVVARRDIEATSKIAATLIAEMRDDLTLCRACFRHRARVTPAVAAEVAGAVGFKMPGTFFITQPNPTVNEILALAPMVGLTEEDVWAKYLQWRRVSPGMRSIFMNGPWPT